MIDSRSRVLLACLLALLVGPWGHAAPDNFADAKTRDIVGGRKVLIVVPGDAIEPTIQPVPVAPGLIALSLR
jgi:hypothetical protein